MLQVRDVQEGHEHEIGYLQRQVAQVLLEMAEMRADLAGRRSLSEL